MLVFASRIPSAFAGIDALQPRTAPRPSTEEQYFSTLAEEHERAAAFARQRLQEARLRQQQRDLEAKLRLQQQLAASLQVHTARRSPYQPRATLDRALPDIIFEFDTEEREAYDGYAERMQRRSQAAMLERQKRAEEQAILRALFEEQRRTQAEHVAELHRKRAEEAKVERERMIRAQRQRAQLAEREQARQHLAARAAEEEKLHSFFEALLSAMNTEKEEGADLERKNAMRRNSVPTPAPVPTATPGPTRAPASAPTSPKAPTPAPRAASPTPSVASDSSDASLHSIAHLQDKYNSLRSSFTFPSTLVFAPTTNNSPASAPALLFNPTNAPIHAYEHALTGLLTELDAVESFGDDHVRGVRRELVRRVEAELEGLEEKKREMWRQSVGSVEVPVAVESVPAPVESAPAPVVESTPAPVAAESTPVPALPTTIDPANPLAWLAARLAQPSESEDNEVKAVRESLAARLASESVAVESEPESVTVESSEPATVESSEPVMAESSESLAVEQPEPSAAEQSESLAVNKPEDLALESSELTVTPRSTEPSPSSAVESQPEAEHEVVESAEPEPIVIEVETVTETHTSTELANSSPALASEPEKLAEPEQLANTAELEQLADTTEPELLAHPTESEVDSPTTSTVPESVVSESESEPEILAAPEPTKFVQVFPDSDSEVDTDVDADMVSELADRKSTSGADEFEML